MKRKFQFLIALAFVFSLAVVGVASTAHAVPITTPTDLLIGDQYRLVFVTNTTRDVLSTDIADYNTFVTTAANTQTALTLLGTTWTAIASTETVDARDNTSTVPSTVIGGSLGVPIFLLNDTKLADTYDDLWDGSIDVSFDVDESGNQRALTEVWTGTDALGGVEFNDEFGLGASGLYSVAGSIDGTGVGWISFAIQSIQLTPPLPLYAISGPLTVPDTSVIPEPATLTLMGIGLAGIGFARRKKKAT